MPRAPAAFHETGRTGCPSRFWRSSGGRELRPPASRGNGLHCIAHTHVLPYPVHECFAFPRSRTHTRPAESRTGMDCVALHRAHTRMAEAHPLSWQPGKRLPTTRGGTGPTDRATHAKSGRDTREGGPDLRTRGAIVFGTRVAWGLYPAGVASHSRGSRRAPTGLSRTRPRLPRRGCITAARTQPSGYATPSG